MQGLLKMSLNQEMQMGIEALQNNKIDELIHPFMMEKKTEL